MCVVEGGARSSRDGGDGTDGGGFLSLALCSLLLAATTTTCTVPFFLTI